MSSRFCFCGSLSDFPPYGNRLAEAALSSTVAEQSGSSFSTLFTRLLTARYAAPTRTTLRTHRLRQCIEASLSTLFMVDVCCICDGSGEHPAPRWLRPVRAAGEDRVPTVQCDCYPSVVGAA